MLRSLLTLALTISFLSACSLTTKRTQQPGKADIPIPATGELPHRVDLPDDSGEGAEPAIPNVKVPKIGIVLGPGGARTYAHIGFLRELEKAKIPVQMVAGLEWGALMGALYSINGKAHEVEWKASKIPEDFAKKGLLSSSSDPKPFSDLEPILKTMFEDAKVEYGKIPFSCITDNLKNFKSLMIFKGTYRDTLGYCLGHPPITTSKNGWIASSMQSKYLIDQVAFRGMDYIILVDVLTAGNPFPGMKFDESTVALWSNINKSLNQNKKYVHMAITIPITKSILDFKSRKEFIQQGEKAGKDAADKIIKQFGL